MLGVGSPPGRVHRNHLCFLWGLVFMDAWLGTSDTGGPTKVGSAGFMGAGTLARPLSKLQGSGHQVAVALRALE